MDKNTIKTSDIFKAAYLYHLCDCDLMIEYQIGVGVVFVISGSSVADMEKSYVGGSADVDLLAFKQGFFSLLEKCEFDVKPYRIFKVNLWRTA